MKIAHIKTDFDKWRDEDDSEDDEQPNSNFEDVCTCYDCTILKLCNIMETPNIFIFLIFKYFKCVWKLPNIRKL
jgi:hypothetical protein